MQDSSQKPQVPTIKMCAQSKSAATDIIRHRRASHIELDYKLAWRDLDDLVQIATDKGIRVTHRLTETVQVPSVEALQDALASPKTSYRRRLLMCEFPLDDMPAHQLDALEKQAIATGDFILPEDFFSSFGPAPVLQH